jgi:ABC-type amino acid transport system permease subunit
MVAILAYAREPGSDIFSVPALRGLNFRGGITIPPELSALAIATAIYGGAYIAEVIRAGFLSVGKGQVEAARALGLSPWHVFSRIHLPLAIRAVLPTLINQYVWLFKATTLGIVVGFADFFSVISVSINQSGQTLELIAILMVGFLVMNNSLSFILNRVNKAIALKGTQLRT